MLPAPATALAPIPAPAAGALIFDTPDSIPGEPPLHHILIRLSHDDGRTVHVEMPVESGSGTPYWSDYAHDVLDALAALSGQAIPRSVYLVESALLEAALGTVGTCRYTEHEITAKVVTVDDLETVTVTVSGFGEEQSARLCIDPHTDLPDVEDLARDWLRDAVMHLDYRASAEAARVLDSVDWPRVLPAIRAGGSVEVRRLDGPILVTLSPA
ncbi:hypothetical protein MYK68_00255 [Gordonia sp. PP30]|uniref:hypothetical protein n=1 Tax=Gordonia sp. PP30 TaxID=2935861 RepID=UPI001FFE4D3C|nr:hypothetical protein [Gordonia sp. PP30]UQE75119.1 hypothetical protein MYK68_00255 [Gordonia sp. PP30]